MPQDRIDEISSLYPNAIPDWNRMKLRLQIQKKKLAKVYKDVLSANRSWRSKEIKKNEKINKQFYQKGIHALLTWDEFVDEVQKSYILS